MTSDIFNAALMALEGGLGVRQMVKLDGSQSVCGLSLEQANGSGIKVKVSLSLCDSQLC